MSDEFKDYVCHYRHDGFEWGITVRATSEADAMARLRAMSFSGRVDGEFVAAIPAYMPVFLVSIIVRIRNWLK